MLRTLILALSISAALSVQTRPKPSDNTLAPGYGLPGYDAPFKPSPIVQPSQDQPNYEPSILLEQQHWLRHSQQMRRLRKLAPTLDPRSDDADSENDHQLLIQKEETPGPQGEIVDEVTLPAKSIPATPVPSSSKASTRTGSGSSITKPKGLEAEFNRFMQAGESTGWANYDSKKPPATLQPLWADAPEMQGVQLPNPPKPISPPPAPPQGFEGVGRFYPPPPPPPPPPAAPLPPPPFSGPGQNIPGKQAAGATGAAAGNRFQEIFTRLNSGHADKDDLEMLKQGFPSPLFPTAFNYPSQRMRQLYPNAPNNAQNDPAAAFNALNSQQGSNPNGFQQPSMQGNQEGLPSMNGGMMNGGQLPPGLRGQPGSSEAAAKLFADLSKWYGSAAPPNAPVPIPIPEPNDFGPDPDVQPPPGRRRR